MEGGRREGGMMGREERGARREQGGGRRREGGREGEWREGGTFFLIGFTHY